MTLLSQPEIQPALRWALLGLLALAGWSWSRRRPGAGFVLFLAVQCLAISFWTSQLHRPVGLDGDVATQEFWARVSAAYASGDARAGYAIDSTAAATPLTRLASAGVPTRILRAASTFAPLLLALSLAFFVSRVKGSRSQRLMTAALASSAAPFWGAPVDLSSFALIDPEEALVMGALLTVAALALSVFKAMHPIRLALVLLATLGIAEITVPSKGSLMEGLADLFSRAAPSLVALALVPPARVFAAALSHPRFRRTTVEALLLVSVAAASPWFWWEPSRTVRGFQDASSSSPSLFVPLAWIAENTPVSGTIASAPEYSALITAVSGRRTLNVIAGENGLSQPLRRERLLASIHQGRPDADLARRFSVTHILLGPGEADPWPAEPAHTPGERGLVLRRIYVDAHDFRLFELVPQ